MTDAPPGKITVAGSIRFTPTTAMSVPTLVGESVILVTAGGVSRLCSQAQVVGAGENRDVRVVVEVDLDAGVGGGAVLVPVDRPQNRVEPGAPVLVRDVGRVGGVLETGGLVQARL